ncbi:hypothetical protein K438DRAFT_1759921 [Mycena galopus ATCC 62051]|nr:hypothetical protein K438DRAFT_1759921 [Mycena galopus ATCC 62051]
MAALQECSSSYMPEGMSRGFAMSSMGDLVLTFNSSKDSGLSVLRCMSILSSKKALHIEDLDNRGLIPSHASVPRFALEKEYLKEGESKVDGMQDILTKAAAMIENHTSCFLVDPRGGLLRVLRGANSLGEVHTAWSALSERADLALRNFDKYHSEFRNDVIPDLHCPSDKP